MKITEKHTRTYEEERVIEERCDWCGAEIPPPRDSSYGTRDFNLEFTEGTNYGHDGGSEAGWQVEDLCDGCVEKLKSLLIQAGITVKEVERDW